MKAMIKNVRLSYVRVFEAAQVNGTGDANYSVCLLIPKDSPEALKLMQEIDAVAQEMKSKYPKLKGQLPKMWSNPLRDGDAEKDGAEYQGMYFINAKRKEKQGAPLLINGAKQYITDKEEMYSGCYGMGVGLNAIQKTRDGERLDGGASIDDFDFEEGEDLSIFG